VYKFLVAFHTGRIHSDSGEHNALIGVCRVWENRRLRGFCGETVWLIATRPAYVATPILSFACFALIPKCVC